MFHGKNDTGRIEFIFDKTLHRIRHIELALTFGSVNLQRLVVRITHAQQISDTQTRDAVVHIGSMEFIGAVALENFTDMREAVEIILHTLHLYHQLTVAIDGQRLVFQTLCSDLYLRQLANLRQDRVIGRGCLSFRRCHLQLRVHLGKE